MVIIWWAATTKQSRSTNRCLVCKYDDVYIVVVFIECTSEARENIIAAVFLAGASVGCLGVLLGIHFVFVVVV